MAETSPAAEYLRELERKNAEARSAPIGDAPDLRENNFEAGAKSLLRGISGGWSDKAEAGIRAWMDGESYEEKKKKVFDRNRALSQQNPTVSMLSEFVGGGMFGMGMGKAGGGIAQLAAEKGPETVSKVVKKLSKATDRTGGRVAKQGVEGAVEGAIYGAGQDQSILGTALFGMGAGVTMQTALGEMLPATGRFLGLDKGLLKQGDVQSARIKQQARDELISVLKSGKGDINHAELADLYMAALQDLGPNATVADMDNALYQFGLKGIKDQADIENAQNWLYKVQQRAANAPEQFRENLEQVLDNRDLLSIDQIKDRAAQDFKRYSPEFEKVLDDVAGNPMYQYKPEQLRQLVSTIFPEDALQIGSVKAAQERINAVLEDAISQRSTRTVGGKQVPVDRSKVALTAQDLHKIRKEIDALYDESIDPFSKSVDKGRAQDLATARNAINELLKDIPGFKAVNKKYAETHRVVKAAEYAEKFMQPGSDAQKFQTFMHTAPEIEQMAFLEAAKYELARTLDGFKGADKIAKQVAHNENMRRKLSILVGPEMAEQIVNSADDIAKFAQKDRGTLKKQDNARSTPPTGPLGSAFDALTAGFGLMTPWVSSAAGLGGLRRSLDALQGTGPRIDQKAYEMLGGQGQGSLLDIFEEGHPIGGIAKSDALADFFTGGAITTTEDPN